MFSNKLIKIMIVGCQAACLSLMTVSGQIKATVTPSYKSDSVVFEGKQTGLRYGATITSPTSGVRHTAVIIVSGTGAQDREGTMAGHKMFAEIAEYLTRQGIVVMRVDDRGVGISTGNYAQSTTADFAQDVLEAFRYIQSRTDLNIKRIGLLGHSEGGATCSIAASLEPKIAFVISLAGLCLNGYDALIIQNHDLVAIASISDAEKQRHDTINEIMFKTARLYADSANMEKKLNECYADWKKKDDEYVAAQHIQYDHFRFPVYSYVKQAIGPWYRYFIKYDPTPVLARVNIPILALNGDKDVMVASAPNLANWKKLPGGGHNRDVTTIAMPGLNHLFLPCATCTVQEYGSIKSPISLQALQIIGSWINKRFQ